MSIKKILLIEDMADWQKTFLSFLSDISGIVVDTANGYDSALKKATSRRYDIILSDTAYDDTDDDALTGLDLREKLVNGQYKHPQFVGMSSINRFQKNWEDKGSYFVSKQPLEYDDFIRTVKRALSN